MKIKIMQYNILNGFHTESYNNPSASVFQPERLEAAQKLVSDVKPDILILNEASFAKEYREQRVLDYPSLFGFPYSFFALKHTSDGTIVLSHFPITGENYTQHYRTFFKTQVDLKGKTIFLDVAHPHPSLNDWEKARFFRACLRDMKTPYIFAGDFNAASDEDTYDREKLIAGFSRFDKNAQGTVDNFLSFHAIPEIRKHGLIDTYKAKNKDSECTIPTNYLSPDKSSGIRMDYIFCSPDFKILEAGIIKNDQSEMASDHYPTFAVLQI